MAYTAVRWRIPGEVLTEQYISMVRIITHNFHINHANYLAVELEQSTLV